MKPTEPPVPEEAVDPLVSPDSLPPAAPDGSLPEGQEPGPRKLTPRKILLLALALILIVVFSGWLTERRLTSTDDMIDGQLSVQPIGEPAPDFRLKSTDGREIKLSEYRGRPVVVSFWASWCVPCMVEMPELVSFYQKQDGKVALLAVSIDDTAEDAKDYAGHNHLPFPILYDGTKRVAAGYDVEGIPALFIVDPNGTIRAHHVGLISSLDSVLAGDVEMK
jgi:peroxiredoxin